MAYTPLASVADFNQGPESDLFRNLVSAEQSDLLIRASMAVEGYCDRRLSPFTGLVETLRAQDIDSEEQLDYPMPLNQSAILGISRAQSLGSVQQVRHFFVREFPPRWPDYWTGALTAVTLFHAFSGPISVDISTIQYEPDTGHVRLSLGTYDPQGTTIQYTQNGGYSTVPEDLKHATIIRTIIMALAEIDPEQRPDHLNADGLTREFEALCGPYVRDPSV